MTHFKPDSDLIKSLRAKGMIDEPKAKRVKVAHKDGASEAQVMSEIVTALELSGYRTPKKWKPGTRGIYIRVSQRKGGHGSGTDEGCPDLIVVKLESMEKFMFEAKARTGDARASAEQSVLEQIGVITFVSSASEVLALLEQP